MAYSRPVGSQSTDVELDVLSVVIPPSSLSLLADKGCYLETTSFEATVHINT